MRPDSYRPDAGTTSPDPIERAHLREPGDASHVMYRYPADSEFDGLLQRFWIPVWSVAPGQEVPQRVLQDPVALVVVSADYARFYGVVSDLSVTTLTGSGWAVGVMCAPAAGTLLTGGSMSRYTDRYVDVADVLVGAAGGLTPKWLIQPRRLQEAVERLRGTPDSLGDVAALLGYADQAHFTRDFARVTAMTPGQFAARHAPGS